MVKRLRSADHICKPLLQKRWTKPLQEEFLRVFVFQKHLQTKNLFIRKPNPPSPNPTGHRSSRHRSSDRVPLSPSPPIVPLHPPSTVDEAVTITTASLGFHPTKGCEGFDEGMRRVRRRDAIETVTITTAALGFDCGGRRRQDVKG
ncbi:hypothetical protein E3N88_09482 [Mikania micrantha]|uniref:Uncharacterized protein n=1 Tax=Mikania micrantha TaxID=192012 RepID=A0A5N6PLD8_9ASTR|nr:hypothetical protein E3N88_09482 [Mikania micrantha]